MLRQDTGSVIGESPIDALQDDELSEDALDHIVGGLERPWLHEQSLVRASAPASAANAAASG